MFIQNYERWLLQAKDKEKIITLIAVNNQKDKDTLLAYNKNLNIKVTGESVGITTPIYALSKDLQANDEDIVIVVCDDINCIEHWDEYFRQEFSKHSGCLYINDGIQDTVSFANLAVTMPVMDYKTLKKIGKIIFHPEYLHYYSDNELYYNLKELGLLIDLRNNGVKFQHEHFYLGHRAKDSHDDNIIVKCSDVDKETFNRRMKLPITERIKYDRCIQIRL